MNWVEFITAIGGLGTLVFGIAFILAILIFRTEIKGSLRTLSSLKLKRGETELSVTQEPKVAPTHEFAPTLQEIAEPKLLEAESTTSAKGQEPDALRQRMIEAGQAKNSEELTAIFEKLQQAEPDAVERLSNEARYYHLQFIIGDTAALTHLQALTKRTIGISKAHASAQYYLGRCYQEVGHFSNAAKAFEIAAENAPSESLRALAVVSLSKSLFDEGKLQEAYDRVMQEIGKSSGSDALFELYKGLADLYKRAGIGDLEVLALEKALEYRPNDTLLHFQAGFAYIDKGPNALSILHYKTFLRFDADDEAALNNIAVAYEGLKMPIRAIASYRQAAEKGNTLAAANLAHELIEHGFVKEASEILDKAKQHPQPHANVGRALVLIEERQNAESELERAVIEAARKQQRYLLAFADAFFSIVHHPNPPTFLGRWVDVDMNEVHITSLGDDINVEWEEDDEKTSFRASVRNRGALLYAWAGGFALGKAIAFAYLSEDGQQLFLLDTRGSNALYYQFNKVE